VDRKTGASMLNEFQRRGLTATFRTLEEMMYEIEAAINSDVYRGILLEIDNDISRQAKEGIIERIRLVREKISYLSKHFDLEKKRKKSSSQIQADLSYCWEILEGSKAQRLRGYGKVAEGLEELLDPQINSIISLITEMGDLIRRS
jgi:hypothetical protein